MADDATTKKSKVPTEQKLHGTSKSQKDGVVSEKVVEDKKLEEKKIQKGGSGAKKVVKVDDSSKVTEKKKESKSPVELTDMLEAGVHFGHQSRRWNPKMDEFIWQNRDGVHIFDLLKVSKCLSQACEAVKEEIKSGKSIAFVGTKRQASSIVKHHAQRAGVAYVVSRWAGGTITNWSQIKNSIKRLVDIKEGMPKGKFNDYTKKERVLLERKAARLERLFGGLVDLKSSPDILFIVDVNREKAAVKEAKTRGIPIYALIDSNSNPDHVNYPIPGNDDAVRSIELIVSVFTDAVKEGMDARVTRIKN